MSQRPVVVVTQLAEHVSLVTIDRPDARNAINVAVAVGLQQAIARLEADPDVRVVILTGAGGKVFCAGADLKEVSQGNLARLFTTEGSFGGFVRAKRTKPWIAAVEGKAVAGGCELALACDLIVASNSGGFSLPEVKRGLIASAGGLFRLPRSVPRAIATEMALTGGELSALRAAALGFVNRLADDGRVVECALQLAQEISQNAPLAVRESLALSRAAARIDDAECWELTEHAHDRITRTEDFAEGPLAFIQKRPPRWQGR